jgi:two-component system NtrC family sensor kinase
VRRLLDFSRRPLAQKQPEPVANVLGAVLGFLTPTLLSKHVDCVAELDALGSMQVLADRNQLESLFIILLSNAMDAMADGGAIKVRARQTAPETVEIVIDDSGCGIAPADRAKLFEPFFTTKPTGKGTGLGLAIAKNIVQEHGGTIRIDSTLGQGTTVAVALPLCHRLAACVGEGP